ncbi:class I glutamine amidotransferase-like protein [Daldinia sp. FL1419]|nr:class I glutamine amidotransferase-like protein [Daldinia sp. FL1419]
MSSVTTFGVESKPIRIAILLNSYRSRLLPAIRASYERTISAVAPDARLAFYEPANKSGQFPDPAFFDLIVIGGSNVDPRKSYQWILDVHNFLRRLVAQYPEKKVLGICWGHQTISRVFGGKVVDAAHPEMGVATINLTEAGREFFPEAAALGSFTLQQHHRREVAVPPPTFVQLAQGNQCLLNKSNTILTFQGHPEKDAETARLRLHDSMRWFGFDASLDEKAWAKLQEMVNMEHDGPAVWNRILEWVKEPPVLGVGIVDKVSKM